jgi:hypothetical protein
MDWKNFRIRNLDRISIYLLALFENRNRTTLRQQAAYYDIAWRPNETSASGEASLFNQIEHFPFWSQLVGKRILISDKLVFVHRMTHGMRKAASDSI